MALQIETICNSIANLHVSGVTIHDIHDIPPTADRKTPCIIPAPEFVTGLTVTRMSTGTGTWKRDVEYDLHYRFLYQELGSMRTGLQGYGEMINMAFTFIDEILANDLITGLVDLTISDATNFGVIDDPAGNLFYGCEFTLHVLEFQDA